MSPLVKRKKERFKLPVKYWLLILTAVSVLLMCLTFMTDFKFNTANYIVGYTLVPFQNGISRIGGFLSDKAELMVQIKDLISEKEALQQQELRLQSLFRRRERYLLQRQPLLR